MMQTAAAPLRFKAQFSLTSILLLLLTLNCRQPGPQFTNYHAPFKRLRVSILSKQSLKRLELESAVVASPTLLLIEQNQIALEGAPLQFSAFSNTLLVQQGARRWNGKLAILHGDQFLLKLKTEPSRIYRGNLEISAFEGKLQIVLDSPVEEYVRAATRAELGPLLHDSAGADALETAMQAAIRSFAFAEKNRHGSMNYDFCDLTHCMHFQGELNGPRGLASDDRPNKATEKIVLLEPSGAALPAYFHSTCGGHLSSPDVMWPGKRSHNALYRKNEDRLIPGGELLCRKSPHVSWQFRINRMQLEKMLQVKEVTHASALRQNNRTRAIIFTISMGAKRITRKMTAAAFLSRAGKDFGWSAIKSNDFTIEKMSSHTDSYLIQGRGLGHGIGLCQYGAAELADQGLSAAEILQFYYPGSQLARVSYEF
jgi:stage II sporulation protein D